MRRTSVSAPLVLTTAVVLMVSVPSLCAVPMAPAGQFAEAPSSHNISASQAVLGAHVQTSTPGVTTSVAEVQLDRGINGHLTIVQRALEPFDVDELMGRLRRGQADLCCGHWQPTPAVRLRERVSQQLGLTPRHLGDVHLSNGSVQLIASTAVGSVWSGGVVAVFLQKKPVQATFVHGVRSQTILLREGDAVMLPEGAELRTDTPLAVAWFHLRSGADARRGVLEYYFAAAVRAHFVAPHDTEKQRRIFRTLTRHPRYWHGFVWSFFGLCVSFFAMWPLLKKAVMFLDRLHAEQGVHSSLAAPSWHCGEVDRKRLPTLLSRATRLDSTADKVLSAPVAARSGRLGKLAAEIIV